MNTKSLGIFGRISYTKLSKSGVILHEEPWFDNLITDVGLDNIATTAFEFYLQYGNSDIPPEYSDTNLKSRIGYSIYDKRFVSRGVDMGEFYRLYSEGVFLITAPIGETLTIKEVGLSSSYSSNGKISTRALLPTTVELSDLEQLQLNYRIYVDVPVAPVITTLPDGNIATTIPAKLGVEPENSSSYAWNVANISAQQGNSTKYSYGMGELGGVTEIPTGALISEYVTSNTYGNFPYDAGSHERLRYIRMPASTTDRTFNVLLWADGTSVFQTHFSVPITKQAAQSFTFRTKISWGRK